MSTGRSKSRQMEQLLDVGHSEPSDIRPLDDRTRELIRASLKITSLGDLAGQLLWRAVISAGATRVRLTVNLDEWRVECEDNGQEGISQQVLQEIASAGSSNCAIDANQHDEGTLRSAAALGKLSIRSKHNHKYNNLSGAWQGDHYVYSTVDRSAGLMEEVPTTESETFTTRVIVRDLFYRLPVRRRHEGPMSAIKDPGLQKKLVWSKLCEQIARSSLPLENATIELFEEERSVGLNVSGRRRRMKLKATTSSSERFADCMNLCQESNAKCFDLGGRASGRSDLLKGCVLLDGSVTKLQRHLFVNSQPVPADASLAEVVADIETKSVKHTLKRSRSDQGGGSRAGAASNSSALLDLIDRALGSLLQRTILSNPPGENSTESNVGSRTSISNDEKGTSMHYMINILLTDHTLLDGKRRKTIDRLWSDLEVSLKEAFQHALRQRGFILLYERKVNHDKEAIHQPQPSSKRELRASVVEKEAKNTRRGKKRRRLGDAVAKTFAEPAAENSGQSAESESAFFATDGQTAKWRDPETGRIFRVDARTGNQVQDDLGGLSDASGEDEDSGRLSGCPKSHMLLSRRLRSGANLESSSNPPDWLSKTLEGWKNPVFGDSLPKSTRQESEESEDESIMNLSQGGTAKGLMGEAASPQKRAWVTRRHHTAPVPGTQLASRFFDAEGCCTGSHAHPRTAQDDSSAKARVTTTKHLFTAKSLEEADVIAQLDRKFILCLFPCPTSDPDKQGSKRTLACIDQHAADERVRVERFFCEYLEACRGSGSVDGESRGLFGLKAPVQVGLKSEEVLRLANEEMGAVASKILQFWVFRWEIQGGTAQETDQQDEEETRAPHCAITHVPQLLRERLSVDRDALGSIFREVLGLDAKAASSTLAWMAHTTAGKSLESDDVEWLSLSRHIPPTLRKLIESKACRGAIMFNDTLTHTQCEDLIRKLSKTQFPFQCAHGRPSVMPLIEIPAPVRTSSQGSEEKDGGQAEGKGKGKVKAQGTRLGIHRPTNSRSSLREDEHRNVQWKAFYTSIT